MTMFLVEIYLPKADAAAAQRAADRASVAAHGLTDEGTAITFVRWIYVPDDETGFFLFEAASKPDVLEVVHRAALPVDRLAIAVVHSTGEEAMPTVPPSAS